MLEEYSLLLKSILTLIHKFVWHLISKKCLSPFCRMTQQNDHHFLVFYCHMTGILHSKWLSGLLVNCVLERCQLGPRWECPDSTYIRHKTNVDKSHSSLAVVRPKYINLLLCGFPFDISCCFWCWQARDPHTQCRNLLCTCAVVEKQKQWNFVLLPRNLTENMILADLTILIIVKINTGIN